MANANQDQNRPGQAGAGQRTEPQDPKSQPLKDDDNLIERRSDDQGIGRGRQAGSSQTADQDQDSDGSIESATEDDEAEQTNRGESSGGSTRRGNP